MCIRDRNTTDRDWFSFIVNGRKYFVMIKHYNSENRNTPVNFMFKKELINNQLTLQTHAVTDGQYHDT